MPSTPDGTQQADSADTPAAAPQDPPEPSVRALAAEYFVPGSQALPRRKRGKLFAVIAGALVAGSLGGLLASFAFDVGTAKPRVKAEQDAEKELDLADVPFSATVDYDNSFPDFWKIVLDRPLTPVEQRSLKAIDLDAEFGKKVWAFLEPLGGRLIRYPSYLTKAPDSLTGGGDWTIFLLNLFSDRQSQLSITDMRAVNISCRPSTAQTLVEAPPEGDAGYEGIGYDLARRDPVPFATDEGPEQGQPYFSHRKIDLGGGMSPGGLRVQSVVKGESCDWEIKATYRDSTEKGGEITLKDGKKPFFSEAVPTDPAQHWIMDLSTGGNWVECRTQPDVEVCGASG